MNDDIAKGNWKQMRGQMRQWWGRLTDDDFEQAAGKKDVLIGKLQERYGYNKQQAEKEVDRYMYDYRWS